MKHPRWLHLVCIAAPLAAIVLLVAGVGRGLALLLWLLCPLAMLLMMRMMHAGSGHGPGHRAAPEQAGVQPSVPDRRTPLTPDVETARSTRSS